MTVRYKVTFRCGMASGIADLAFDQLTKFAMGKTIDNIQSYVVSNDPYHNPPRDEDMDYDKSRHRCM